MLKFTTAHNSLLTDLELKALYEASKLTIIPLKNSPTIWSKCYSSVNAVETPVMITKLMSGHRNL